MWFGFGLWVLGGCAIGLVIYKLGYINTVNEDTPDKEVNPDD